MDQVPPRPFGQRVSRALPFAAALVAAVILVTGWGLVALNSCPKFLYHDEGIYVGWMGKALTNGFISDPFFLQRHFGPNEGGIVVLALLLVPIFHFLGDSLFHLTLAPILFQGLIIACLVLLCWRVWGAWAAIWAGLFLFCAPHWYFRFALKPFANHCDVPLFGLLNGLVLWRVFLRLHREEGPSLLHGFLLGLVNGFGFFFHFDHIPVIVADGILFLALLGTGRLRPAGAAVGILTAAAGFVAGLSPWIYRSIEYGEAHKLVFLYETAIWDHFSLGDPVARTAELFKTFYYALVHPLTDLDIRVPFIERNFDFPWGVMKKIQTALFVCFPAATTLGFAALTTVKLLRKKHAPRLGVEIWCLLVLLVHMIGCWTLEYSVGSTSVPLHWEQHQRYMFPILPLLCAMAGASFSSLAALGREGWRRRLVKPAVLAGQGTFGLILVSLTLLTWVEIYLYGSCHHRDALHYKGYSDRIWTGFFSDPVARMQTERHNLLRPETSLIKLYLAYPKMCRVHDVEAGWEYLEGGIEKSPQSVKRLLPALAFELGDLAGLEGFPLETVCRTVQAGVPPPYRHYFFMGYTYFLRLQGVEETGRAAASLHHVDPEYRHYFLVAHGAAVGMKHRDAPEAIGRALEAWTGDDLAYLAAGVLGTPAGRHGLPEPPAQALPQPVRDVLRDLGRRSWKSSFGRGAHLAKEAITAIDRDSHMEYRDEIYDPRTTAHVDWAGLARAIERSPRPNETSRGAGAGLALLLPWRIPWPWLATASLPDGVRIELLRGYREAALWLFHGDESAVHPSLPEPAGPGPTEP